MRTPGAIARGVLVAALVAGLSGCGGGGGGVPETSGSSSTPPAPPPPVSSPFVDVTTASNIAYVVNYTTPLSGTNVAESTFGGAAAGDCDTDGDVDLFITYGDQGPNRLYINQLNGGSGVPLQFLDTAAAAGVAITDTVEVHNDRHSGPTFADMDGDGDLDLFIGGLFTDSNKLYRNRGDCTFEDVTTGSGLDNMLADQTISAAFGDYDLDGYLDLFLTHWGSVDEFPSGGESEHLFRNVSDASGIRFENVSAASGVTAHLVSNRDYSSHPRNADYTYTPTFARINEDYWPDIALAADFGTTQLLLNDGTGAMFQDASNTAVHSVQYGMGSALGDLDFDGDLDWFVSAVIGAGGGSLGLTGNVLLENPGGDFSMSGFSIGTNSAGVAYGGWGWGSCIVDLDNDTDLDIYHTNGWTVSYLEDGFDVDQSVAFISDGAGRFTDRAGELGLDDAYNGRGVVCADFDNDGDIDILQLTNNKFLNSAALWENVSAAAGRNFLRVQLIGLPPNTEAAGARIFATIGTRTQMREIMIGSNYTSQNPTVQIFGLGSATSVDQLRVEWPALAAGSGPVTPDDTVRTNVSAGIANQTLIICHPDLPAPVPAVCS